MNSYSKSRPYLISASVLDFVCTAAYFIVAVILILMGVTLLATAGTAPDSSTTEEIIGTMFSAPFGAMAGVLCIIFGALCFIAVAVALASAITGIVKVNKPVAELKKSTKVIKASYILNFIATGAFFFIALLAIIGSIEGGSDGSSDGGVIAGISIMFIISGIRCACGVLKIKAINIISAEDDQSLQPQAETCIGSEENSDN